MKWRIFFLTMAIQFAGGKAWAQDFDAIRARHDFLFLWEELNNKYAYFDKKQTDWARVKEIYLPKLERINSKYRFILLLEKVLSELYDSHTHLNVNTAQSIRVIPSGTDLWGEVVGGKYMISAVRQGAKVREKVRAGDQVLTWGNAPVRVAVRQYLGASIDDPGPEATSWAFRTLLAGDYRKERKLTVKRKGRQLELNLGICEYPLNRNNDEPLFDLEILSGDLAYLRINNSLGDNRLVKEFGKAIDELPQTKGLILDLRNTPGGGNTLVGRAILGKFTNAEKDYQKHELPGEERTFGIKRSWTEIVSPNGKTYEKPIVILLNRWTGSMGEGLAVGFDAMKRATSVGTKMAELNGAIYFFDLPNSGFRVSYTAEKLYHINGTPREDYVPDIQVDLQRESADGDLILETGLHTLRQIIQKN